MKKKLLALLLCLTMLLSAVAIFASCGEDEEPTPEGPDNGGVALPTPGEIKQSESTATFSLNGFKIIRPEYNSYTDALKQQAIELSAAIAEATRLTIRISDDTGALTNGDKEILLGFGERDVAAQALSEIEGAGWIIRSYADQDKIVIAGTTEFLTGIAIDYFVNNCLGKSNVSGTDLTISDKIICNNIEMIDIVGPSEEDPSTYESKFSVVYREGIDDDPKNAYGDQPHTTNFDRPFEFAESIRTAIVKATGIKAYTIPFKYDTAPANDGSGKGEILVGTLNRPDTRAVLDTLTANQYALVVMNNQIIVGAHNDTMLANAYALCSSMIQQSLCTTAEGHKYISIPANYSSVKTDEKRTLVVDFPRPDNVQLIETADVGQESLLHIFTGEGVSREGFLAYCAKLEADGYEVVSDDYQAEGSSFRTYLNSSKKITLHVSHQAHAHAADQKVTTQLNSIRVVSASTKKVTVNEELFNKDRTWIKKTDSMMTNYELNRSVGVWGNSYIFTLEDGSFIVYDGGYNGDANVGKDEDYLYNVLRDLFIKVHGVEPTPQNPIRISAWLMSHEHGDHFGVMKLFFQKYGRTAQSGVKIERLMASMISAEERVNSYNPETQIQTRLEDMKNQSGCEIIRVHTGETYYLANMAIQILYTHEDLFPVRLGYFNNSSTVYRMCINSTDVAKNTEATPNDIANTQTVVMLGDLERNGSKCLRSMWGEAMQADMVQVAHHGYNGCEEALYKLINPEVVWFPCNSNELKRNAQSAYASSNNWINAANYGVCREIERVKLIVSGGDCNTLATGYNFTLTMTADGIDYVNFYDALNHKVVETEDDIPQPGQAGGFVILRPGK